MATTTDKPRRQKRGLRRIDQILDTAADVFAEVGYERATTNAIAARAGISPGSLYQFFSKKEDIAGALATRYLDEMRELYVATLRVESADLPFDEALDVSLDPLIEFNVANPAFHSLLEHPTAPAEVTGSKPLLTAAIEGRIDEMLAARAPRVAARRRRRAAQVTVKLFVAMVPLIVGSDGRERAEMIRELKLVLRGYLGPLVNVDVRERAVETTPR